MDHDQLFKKVLQEQLQGFIELFFPEVAARLDFRSLSFLDKEIFTDFPEGSRRELDVVAEINTDDGSPELILVHIEVQARPEKELAERMFEYYVLLRRRYQVPVFPVVVYLRGGTGSIEEVYRETLFGREQLRFRYASIGLAELEAEEYVEKSPLAAALAALMNRRRVADRVELRTAIMGRIARSGLDEAQRFLLFNFAQTYFELGEAEMERFRRLLSEKGYWEVEEMEVTWADKMMEKGREEGRRQGLEAGVLAGKRETLLRLLTAKFGPVPEKARRRVQALASVAELDAYLERVLTAESLDAMGFGAQ